MASAKLPPAPAPVVLPAGVPPLSPTAKQSQYGARRTGMPLQAVEILANVQFEGHPQPVGVHLYRSRYFDPAVPIGNIDCHAEVRYGCGASMGNTFLCDWRGQFSLVCSSLTVNLLPYVPYAASLAGPGVDPLSSFGAHVGLGGCSSSEGPTYTSETVQIARSTGASHRVPNFGQRYFPFVSLGQGYGQSEGGMLTGAAVVLTEEMLADLTVEVWSPSNDLLLASRLTPEMVSTGILLPMHAGLVTVANRSTRALNFDFQVTHLFKLAL